jgi:hypothetical protein
VVAFQGGDQRQVDASRADPLRRVHLERREHVQDQAEFLEAQWADIDAVARPDLDQALLGESDDGLAHGRPADVEHLGEGLLQVGLARLEQGLLNAPL